KSIMIAMKVRKERTQEALKYLLKNGLVDRNRKTCMKGDFVLIPLSARPLENITTSIGGEITEFDEFLPRKSSKPIERIKEILDIPEELKAHIPFKWELVGDVLIFKVHPMLNGKKKELAEAYSSVLKAKTVFEDVGGIEDEFRVPRLEKILGEDGETVHRENGVLYMLDASRLMFSSGNKSERMRMAKVDMKEELVVDMFAGIGYFSLPIAMYSSPRKVISCEKNPIAFNYLKENIMLNRLDNVRPVLKDCMDLEIEEKADRIIMGYVKDTYLYLPKAFEMIEKGGTIHYHDACPTELLPNRVIEKVKEKASKCSKEVKVVDHRVVKSYAPKVAHVVFDLTVS
ncbi:MAG: class I SAM-dependent methyltransferase family protein, partial [Thermoplasmata archaeon]|nr:class I SAM-dependent methyltransferase family protein [Thermoplasmata archaeon]